MTAAAALIAILVGAGDAQAPEITAMLAAAVEAAGSPDAIRLVPSPALSDDEALRSEQALSVRASVQLFFVGTGRLHARLRLHAARTERWIDRELVFTAADSDAERGRALGFAIASMLPEGDPSLRLEPATTPEPEPEPPARPLGQRVATLAACAGAGLGGPASGWGGSLRLAWGVAERFSIGGGVAARTGHIDEVAGRAVAATAGVGGAWWPVVPTSERRLGVAVRGELLLLYHLVSHERMGGGTEWKGYALPGAGLLVEGSYRLAGALELLLAGGAELAFGTVDVTVVAPSPAGGSARIPPLRGLAEAGIRLRF
jgi:hypothetical protein